MGIHVTDYDLIVVGTRNNIASGAARSDYGVALVEKETLGGTCLSGVRPVEDARPSR